MSLLPLATAAACVSSAAAPHRTPVGGTAVVAALVAGLAGLLAAAPAHASEWAPDGPPPGTAASYRIFGSLGGGVGEHAFDCLDRLDCQRSTGAARATLAVALLPGLALEGVALDFGTSEWERRGVRVEERPRLYGLGLMAPLDIGPRLGVELRGGLAQVETRRERSSAGGSIEETRRNSAQWYLGAALVMQLAPNAGLFLAVDASQADLEQGTARVSATTAGLSLRF